MLYLLIVCRDCFEPNYIKIVGGVTALSIVLDVVWISYYKVKITQILALVEWNR